MMLRSLFLAAIVVCSSFSFAAASDEPASTTFTAVHGFATVTDKDKESKKDKKEKKEKKGKKSKKAHHPAKSSPSYPNDPRKHVVIIKD